MANNKFIGEINVGDTYTIQTEILWGLQEQGQLQSNVRIVWESAEKNCAACGYTECPDIGKPCLAYDYFDLYSETTPRAACSGETVEVVAYDDDSVKLYCDDANVDSDPNKENYCFVLTRDEFNACCIAKEQSNKKGA